MAYRRYAVYYTPPPGALADFGAAWLGWDLETGQSVAHPDIEGLPHPIDDITSVPRKYGFHATLKPPFRLAPGRSEADLTEAVRILGSRTLHPVTGLRLKLSVLGRFLALTAEGNTAQLGGLAAMCVETLDVFRAPPTEAELAKRRAGGLSHSQETMLLKWGYPHVMDQFKFHMTLTGKLPKSALPDTQAALAKALASRLSEPFTLDQICVVGEDAEGRFHLIERHVLTA
ncbi:MAG: DUF1045 domain-containing protein [Pseudomonadota bacterium]